MEYTVQITQKALADIADIFKYISQDLNEPEAASKMKDAILSCADSLSVFPLRNKLIDEEPYHTGEIRKAIIKNYYIIYQVKKDVVLILRVLYNRRDWQNII